MVGQQMLAFEALMRVALRRADVVAGRKVLAVAGEDDDLDRVVVNRATECRVERVGHLRILRVVIARTIHRDRRDRSEEHTSELQSLMRISYAVFCLKKKRQN